MSLDIELKDPKEKYSTEPLYSANITHNLSEMAARAGIYKAIWRPEEIGAYQAKDIIKTIEEGLMMLKYSPAFYRRFNSPNRWGTYRDFVPFVEEYLAALKKYPEAIIEVDR